PSEKQKIDLSELVNKAVKDAEVKVESAYKFAPLSSKVFASKKFNIEWLVKNLLVKGQPCIWGGPKKSLKTTLGVDLALSLGSGQPYLGKFEVPKPVRTAFISGESGGWTVQET